ncbi:hypothetical protein FH972_001366 [Carpinus fangiana]|uniref:Signal peptidase complex subunit 2 n=1 Tax=Carpinus fangiana TaxID=176857 RepID=A0A5N6QDW3_9ROSI|nr:hypothetical protein FH972_001366 [Carpinus fangiana]
MQEKKPETAAKNPKKANLLDHHSIKHLLDESISEIVTGRGYAEDVRMSNVRLVMGTIIIIIALVAQFYKKKFPENRDFLIACIYIVFNGLLQLFLYTKEKNAILFTYPPAESFTSTGLVVSSKLPRFSDMYTLTIASADPKSISANEPVHLTKSVHQGWSIGGGPILERSRNLAVHDGVRCGAYVALIAPSFALSQLPDAVRIWAAGLTSSRQVGWACSLL